MKQLTSPEYLFALLVTLQASFVNASVSETAFTQMLETHVLGGVKRARMHALTNGEPYKWFDELSNCCGVIIPSPSQLMRFAGREMECRDFIEIQMCQSQTPSETDTRQSESVERACRFLNSDDWRVLP